MNKLRQKLVSSGAIDPLGLISPERMEVLRAEAKEKALVKLRKRAEEEFLARETELAERELNPKPEHELRNIIIDVAEHTEYIRIDGKQFYYGHSYTVEKPVYDQLQDIMARGWRHNAEISNPTAGIRSKGRYSVSSIGGVAVAPPAALNF